MRLSAISAVVILAFAGPAMAQAPTAGEVAGGAMMDFCLPLFGPGAMHADRISATASMAGLSPAPGGARPVGFERAQMSLVARSSADSMVLVYWVANAGTCQIVVLGERGAGDDLVAALPQIGWTPTQTGVATGPNTAADIFSGQPRGYDSELMVVANRWVSQTEPAGYVRLVVNMMRAQ